MLSLFVFFAALIAAIHYFHSDMYRFCSPIRSIGGEILSPLVFIEPHTGEVRLRARINCTSSLQPWGGRLFASAMLPEYECPAKGSPVRMLLETQIRTSCIPLSSVQQVVGQTEFQVVESLNVSELHWFVASDVRAERLDSYVRVDRRFPIPSLSGDYTVVQRVDALLETAIQGLSADEAGWPLRISSISSTRFTYAYGPFLILTNERVESAFPLFAASEECVVCLSKTSEEEGRAYLRCGHFFHYHCISEWLRVASMCPTCREPDTPS
jgi:hypothetical protein